MRKTKAKQSKIRPETAADSESVTLPVSPTVAAALQAEVSPVPWCGGKSPNSNYTQGLNFWDYGKRFIMQVKLDVGSEATLNTADGRAFWLKVAHLVWERDGKRRLPVCDSDFRQHPNQSQTYRIENHVREGSLSRAEALEWIAVHLQRSVPPMFRDEIEVCITPKVGASREPRLKAKKKGQVAA